MTTVAEGVETQAQLDYLVREGCDESQGYLHSRPLPKVEFERLLGFSNTGTRRQECGANACRRPSVTSSGHAHDANICL
jgi:predicted signal transduction protein with EAL and GGDEF domain